MNKKLLTWLAGVRSAFPTAFSPYWRVLPLGRMKMFLAGYFFVGATGGFAFDLLQLNASRVLELRHSVIMFVTNVIVDSESIVLLSGLNLTRAYG